MPKSAALRQDSETGKQERSITVRKGYKTIIGRTADKRGKILPETDAAVNTRRTDLGWTDDRISENPSS